MSSHAVPRITMYLTGRCPYCRMALRLLEARSVAIQKIWVDYEPARRSEMIDRAGRHTVPQIFIDGQHVGGYSELYQLADSGALDRWLGI